MKKKLFTIITYLFALTGFIFFIVFIAMQFGLLNVRGSIIERNQFFGQVKKKDDTNGCLNIPKTLDEEVFCAWFDTAEWEVVREGLRKDASIIQKVSEQTGVSSRMIASAVVPEQIRFFTSNRESFKRYFEPFKILGSMSQFSLGISGIKQETANDIEKNANDSSSLFYPGDDMVILLKYPEGVNHDTELYKRLTDSKDHYYSYLYTALYLKEIESQWESFGFDVYNRPDVLVTLFNLGFKASVPKANPKVAGSLITVGGKSYSFGLLGASFYQSNELIDIFPN